MNLFGTIMKSGGAGEPSIQAADKDGQLKLDLPQAAQPGRRKQRTGRTEVYAVRVRESFKGEILRLQAELQLERQAQNGKASKVTEGEVIELMLEAFKAARRNGEAGGVRVPVANDVWQGAHEIARHQRCSPAEVIEHLVAQKAAELNVVPRR